MLVSRLQPDMRIFEWVTLTRTWEGDLVRGASVLLPPAWHMDHNAALVCVDGTLHAFGGQYRNYTGGKGEHARGIRHSTAASHGPLLRWSEPRVEIAGYTGHCHERRSKFAPYCEFDGRLSAVYYRGRFLVFARANLAAAGGARHVQMTSAEPEGEWSRFQLVSVPGVRAGDPHTSIYFMLVQVWRDRLLSLFPAVLHSNSSSAGIYVSTSVDGVAWEPPQLLLHTPSQCGRTRAHPVRFVEGVDELVVLHNIDLSEPLDIPQGRQYVRGASAPYLRRYRVDVDGEAPATRFRLSDAPARDLAVEAFNRSLGSAAEAAPERASASEDAAPDAMPGERVVCCVEHGATKRAAHKQVATAECTPQLRFLADRLFLFSFILADDADMLWHWLRHYHGLGVRPTHTYVAVRARHSATEEQLQATLQALAAGGVPQQNLRVVRAPPSDSLKLELINQRIAALPAGSWFVYADVDELFDYPCSLEVFTRRSVCLLGVMWDQLAADGNITELAGAPDLSLQFPLQCRVRTTLARHMNPHKVILHRVDGRESGELHRHRRIMFRNTHAVNSSQCGVLGISRHYILTTRQMASNAQKAALQPLGADLTSTLGAEPVRLNWANATCGNFDARTGQCADYSLLLHWMQQQVQRSLVGNGVTAYPSHHMCPVSLAPRHPLACEALPALCPQNRMA